MISETGIYTSLHAAFTVMLCVFMVGAVITDIREHRIRNSMVVMVLFLGLLAQLTLDMPGGVISWGIGLLIGFLIFVPFYLNGGMGAGDVKLMAAVAAFLGPTGGAIACGSALLAGLPLAVFYMIKNFAHTQMFASDTSDATGMFTVDTDHKRNQTHDEHSNCIPYAAAIFAGTTVGLWWTGSFEPIIAGLLP